MLINPLSGLDLTLGISKVISQGAIDGYDTDNDDNSVFACNVVLPASNTSNGCLFEKGGTGTGAWVGIRDSGATFRVRAGDGGVTLSSSNSITAVLDVPTSSLPMDGNSHSVIWEFNPSGGTVKLWVDGVSYGTGATTGGGALEGGTWEGTGTGSYGGEQNVNISGEPSTAWTSISSLESDLYYFDGQTVTATDNGGYGYWKYGNGAYSTVTVHNVTSTVTASSSASAIPERQMDFSGSTTANASITCNARRVPQGSALVNGTSTTSVNTTANGSVTRNSGGTVTATGSTTSSATATYSVSVAMGGSSSTTVSYERIKLSSGNLSALSSVTASAVSNIQGSGTGVATATSTIQATRVREQSAILTPTSVVSASANITAKGEATSSASSSIPNVYSNVVIDGGATSSASASVTSNGERIRIGVGLINPSASVFCVGQITAKGVGVVTSSSTITATCNRVQHSGATVSSTSGTFTIGREKWEVIPPTSTTWTTIAA